MGGMGFRDLKTFNQALPAKQMWRLHTMPNSLAYSILKARYFKHDSALEARRGYDPSYCWRSIWGSKALLLDGLKWRVGNGKSIKVWTDSWLPGKPTTAAPSHGPHYDPNLCVADLLVDNGESWNVQLINETFAPDDCMKILQLPTSFSQHDDVLFWWPSNTGEYNVKSGYWLGRLGHLCEAESRLTDDDKKLWNLVWNAGRPPKLNHFVWKACRGSLLVKEMLLHRHIAPDNLCDRCKLASESILHVVVDCPVVTDAWTNSNLLSLLSDAPRTSVKEFLLFIHSKTDKFQFNSILAIMRGIWFCRNKSYHDDVALNTTYITAGFKRNLEEYGAYAKRVFSPSVKSASPSPSGWIRPPVGTIKINVDAYLAATGYVGVGAAVRDHYGNLVASYTRRFVGSWDVTQAEVAVVRYGLQIGRMFGYDNVWLECDSTDVVNKMLGILQRKCDFY